MHTGEGNTNPIEVVGQGRDIGGRCRLVFRLPRHISKLARLNAAKYRRLVQRQPACQLLHIKVCRHGDQQNRPRKDNLAAEVASDERTPTGLQRARRVENDNGTGIVRGVKGGVPERSAPGWDGLITGPGRVVAARAAVDSRERISASAKALRDI